MENGNIPAHPIQHQYGFDKEKFGLTKREYFAVTILQGVSSCDSLRLTSKERIAMSIEMADELLTQLETSKATRYENRKHNTNDLLRQD